MAFLVVGLSRQVFGKRRSEVLNSCPCSLIPCLIVPESICSSLLLFSCVQFQQYSPHYV